AFAGRRRLGGPDDIANSYRLGPPRCGAARRRDARQVASAAPRRGGRTHAGGAPCCAEAFRLRRIVTGLDRRKTRLPDWTRSKELELPISPLGLNGRARPSANEPVNDR